MARHKPLQSGGEPLMSSPLLQTAVMLQQRGYLGLARHGNGAHVTVTATVVLEPPLSV